MPRPPAPAVKPVSSRGPSGLLIGGVVILIIALIGGLVWAASSNRGGLEGEGSTNALPEGGGVSAGPGADADVTQVHVYGDFQCPWCGVLEQSVGAALEEKVQAGEINLTVTLMSFLDGRIDGENSLRAANAALCADDAGAFLPYYQSVYDHQPQEGAGWTDEQLISLAEDAGIDTAQGGEFRSCLDERTHADYVADMQERANRDGVSGTPRLFVNGEQISDEQMQALMEDPSTLDAVLGTDG